MCRKMHLPHSLQQVQQLIKIQLELMQMLSMNGELELHVRMGYMRQKDHHPGQVGQHI